MIEQVDEATVFKLLTPHTVDQKQARIIGNYLGIRIHVAQRQQSTLLGGGLAVCSPLLVNSISSDLGASFSPVAQTVLNWMPIAVVGLCAISLLVFWFAVKKAEAMLETLKLTAAISEKVREVGRIMAAGVFLGKYVARRILK